MHDLPLRNIFLPATLVASTFFSVLTLPAVLLQSPDDILAWLPSSKRPSQIDLAYIHKEVMIPYIGTTIILSAGAGVVTAELVRKRLSAKQTSANEIEATADPQEGFDNFLSISAGDESSLMPTLPLTDDTFKWPTFDREEPLVSASVISTSDDSGSSLVPQKAESEAMLSKTDTSMPQEKDHKIVIFPGQYRRCRIQLPHVPEQQYAIEFNEQFYSLLIAGISKDDALKAVEDLATEDRTAIVTPMNQGHAVWVLEPAAQQAAVA